ncbi:MAG: hypothetical protein AAGE01_19985 [Pseudomonadota bacterium]
MCPKREIKDDLVELLRDAAETGEVLRMKYHGGSQPGSVRQISPLAVEADRLRARCMATDRVKRYYLDRIELLGSGPGDSDYDLERIEAEPPSSLTEGLTPHKERLESAGWVLVIDRNSASVHRRFKNGKVRKTGDVGIHFREDDDVEDWIADGDGELTVRFGTYNYQRPWSVSGLSGTSNFSHLGRAIEKFIRLCEEAAVELEIPWRPEGSTGILLQQVLWQLEPSLDCADRAFPYLGAVAVILDRK